MDHSTRSRPLLSFVRISRRFFSFSNLLALAVCLLPFFLPGTGRHSFSANCLGDPDIWWHLRNAETLFHARHVVTRDPYSFTTFGQRWINPEWLAEVPFYLGWRLWGDRGVYYVGLLAFDLLAIGVFRLALRRSRDVVAACVAAGFYVLLALVNFGPRTILFGYLCLLAEFTILERARTFSRGLWALPPLFALWINLHGSWMSGLVFFVLFIAAGLVEGTWGSVVAERWSPEQLRQLLAVFGACLAALFVNHYGWRLVVYPLDLFFHQKLNITYGVEWQSVDFHQINGRFLFVAVAAVAIMSLLRGRMWRLYEVLFTVMAVYSACVYVRFLFLAGLVLAPIIAAEIAGDHPAEQADDEHPVLNAALMAFVLLIAFVRFPRTSTLYAGREEAFPSQAFARLSTFNPHDHVLNAYGYGGYMIWNTRNIPVFIDSRTDIFEYHGILADYGQAVNIQDTLHMLDKYGIRYVFFPKSTAVIYLLQHTPGWTVNYDDGNAVIMERQQPRPTT